MAANEVLAERMRDVLAGRRNIEERRMFGGLCFLMNGNMLCGVSGSGDDRYMFRVGKALEAEALSRPGAAPMDFTGRKMGGLVWVDPDQAIEAGLTGWVDLAEQFVGALPAKVKR